MPYLSLAIGLLFIIKSADILIESSSKIAKRYGVPPFIIGITVIAFGTSAPELVVGIMSGISKTNSLTLGNVIGSTFSNTALIIGLSALIMPLPVKDTIRKKEFPMLLVVEGMLLAMVLWDGQISRIDGIILLVLFLIFLLYILKNAKQSTTIEVNESLYTSENLTDEEVETDKRSTLPWLIFLTILSLAGLFIGGNLTINSSSQIALQLGLSETIIGITVVSIATTIPELITSVVAVRKKEPDIVLGNCIGSNIFNMLLVLGSSATIHPINTNQSVFIDLSLMTLISIFVWAVSFKQKKITSKTSFLLVSFYVFYFIFTICSTI